MSARDQAAMMARKSKRRRKARKRIGHPGSGIWRDSKGRERICRDSSYKCLIKVGIEASFQIRRSIRCCGAYLVLIKSDVVRRSSSLVHRCSVCLRSTASMRRRKQPKLSPDRERHRVLFAPVCAATALTSASQNHKVSCLRH